MIVGKVTKVGKDVKGFKEGDLAAVGCLVNSCHNCPSCKENLEQYCEKGFTLTYNSPDPVTKKMTYAGYSNNIVVDEKFVLKIPKEFKEKDLAGVAPLLCAGITTYSPLRHWKVKKGDKVGMLDLVA
ncbi:putative zinc-type alcohol dehydrogenase-like protein YahK [Candidatus Rubidus massiliensis]|nr:putative zinc-type alcohol dehydrogenase-like protein YahK [Candidatus Rubidus massiliensis]